MTGHFNYNACAMCGGRCCKHHAGIYVPDDFKEKITQEYVIKLLDSGFYAIDWWEDDPPIYYVRPRHVGAEAIDASWGGVCVRWSEKGCSLSEGDRPHQCRMLVPNYDEKTQETDCDTNKSDKASKYDCAVAWKDYQPILKAIVHSYAHLPQVH